MKISIFENGFDHERNSVEERYFISIVDPFDHEHNPGNIVKAKSVQSIRMIKKFEKAISYLENNKISCLFLIKNKT